MIPRAWRASGAALVALMVLLGVQNGIAAHSGAKPHRSRHRHTSSRPHAAHGRGVGVARFNREAYSYHASAGIRTEAHRYAVIVLQSMDGALVSRLHAANPRLKVLVYQDALLSSIGDPHGYTTCTVNNPAWFLRDALGRAILDASYPAYNVMDVASPGYRQACVAHAIAQAKRFGFNGIFMDGVTAWVGYTFAPNVFAPRYTTPAAWQQATTVFVSYLASQAHARGLLALANIGGSRLTPGLWQRWTSLLDGSEEESWTDAGLGLNDQILDWPTKLANVAWSEAHHKYALVHSYNAAAAGNEYGLASMLLVAGGWSSYATNNRDSAAPDLWRGIYVTAEHLGPPTSGYAILRNGVYVRRFAHGIVLVNPTARSVGRFALGRRYASGPRGAVTSTRMAPTSGLILLKAAGARRKARHH